MFRDTSATDQPLARSSRPSPRLIVGAALAAAVVLAFVLLVVPILGAEHTVPRDRLRIVEVREGTLVRDVSSQGRVVAARSPSLYTEAAGIVRFVVEPGAQVSKGAVLVEVDSPELVHELKREESALARVVAERDRQEIAQRRTLLERQRAVNAAKIAEQAARRELERTRQAHARGALPEIDLKRAEDTLEGASLTLATAQADLALERDGLKVELRTYDQQIESQRLLVGELRRRFEGLAVRAPFDGVVGNWLVSDRANVGANQALLTIVDLGELEVEAAVPEVYADTLAPGQSVEISASGKRYSGRLRLVSPEVQNAEVLARIRLDGNIAGELRQNQRVQVRVLLEEKPDVLLVERGPAFERDASFAWVVCDDRLARRPIRLGASSVAAFEIVSGLSAGEQVVVAGIDDFRGADEVVLTR